MKNEIRKLQIELIDHIGKIEKEINMQSASALYSLEDANDTVLKIEYLLKEICTPSFSIMLDYSAGNFDSNSMKDKDLAYILTWAPISEDHGMRLVAHQLIVRPNEPEGVLEVFGFKGKANYVNCNPFVKLEILFELETILVMIDDLTTNNETMIFSPISQTCVWNMNRSHYERIGELISNLLEIHNTNTKHFTVFQESELMQIEAVSFNRGNQI